MPRWIGALVTVTRPAFRLSRCVGKFQKLEIKKIGHSTIRDILSEQGISLEPDHKDCWKAFLKRRVETLWATGFIRVKSVTAKGFHQLCGVIVDCRRGGKNRTPGFVGNPVLDSDV